MTVDKVKWMILSFLQVPDVRYCLLLKMDSLLILTRITSSAMKLGCNAIEVTS